MWADSNFIHVVTGRLRTGVVLPAILLMGVAVACTSGPAGSEDVTDAFYGREVRSIYVLPPKNLTTAPEATDLVQKYFVGQLKRCGYDVASPSDATMHVTIESWSRQLDVQHGGSRRRARLSAKLYDRSTGQLLWSNEASVAEERDEEDNDEKPDDWLAGALASLVDFGLNEAVEPFMESAKDVAKDCVAETLSTVPRAGEKQP